MTKRSGILLALGMTAAVVSAALAMSVNFGIGATAQSEPLVKSAQEQTKKQHEKPIVKTRHITVHREKKARNSGPTTVYRAAPSTSSYSGSGSSSGSSSYEHESEHESEHEGGGEGGDD